MSDPILQLDGVALPCTISKNNGYSVAMGCWVSQAWRVAGMVNGGFTLAPGWGRRARIDQGARAEVHRRPTVAAEQVKKKTQASRNSITKSKISTGSSAG